MHVPDHAPVLYSIATPASHDGAGPVVNSTKCCLLPESLNLTGCPTATVTGVPCQAGLGVSTAVTPGDWPIASAGASRSAAQPAPMNVRGLKFPSVCRGRPGIRTRFAEGSAITLEMTRFGVAG